MLSFFFTLLFWIPVPISLLRRRMPNTTDYFFTVFLLPPFSVATGGTKGRVSANFFLKLSLGGWWNCLICFLSFLRLLNSAPHCLQVFFRRCSVWRWSRRPCSLSNTRGSLHIWHRWRAVSLSFLAFLHFRVDLAPGWPCKHSRHWQDFLRCFLWWRYRKLSFVKFIWHTLHV